jgi:hypothetical protein
VSFKYTGEDGMEGTPLVKVKNYFNDERVKLKRELRSAFPRHYIAEFLGIAMLVFLSRL